MLTTGYQETEKIPPLAYQDYPVDIQIRIRRNGARYEADILAVGKSHRVNINMSPQDLEVLNRDLQKEIQTIACANIEQYKLTKREQEEQLRLLAEIGNFAFKEVFGSHDAIVMIKELLSISQNISFQITSEDFFVPWELFYPVSLDEPLSYENFWGMNYNISRVIVQDARPGAFVSPIISVYPRPKVGLLTYRELKAVEEKEIPFFMKLADMGEIVLFRLPVLDPKKKQEGFERFKKFWGESFDVAHFACHASYAEESPNLSQLLLSDEFLISLRDLKVYEIVIKGNPLIIMNACETGNHNPLYTSYFASAFLQYGARGVVATECAILDTFAANFAEQLYIHLLAGKTLGESLLFTRRHFLEQYHNPSGLLYSMYASPSIRLVRQNRNPDSYFTFIARVIKSIFFYPLKLAHLRKA